MPRVVGVHIIELQPGVQTQEFEKFVLEEYFPALPWSEWPGMEIHLLKGDLANGQANSCLCLSLIVPRRAMTIFRTRVTQPNR
jgi:hypothetical protein